MLTKSDIRSISTLLDDKLSPVKKDLSGVKQDVSSIKQNLSAVTEDIYDMKSKLNNFASLMLSAVNNILEWTQDIHESIVKEKLPQRVKKLEQFIKTS